MIGEDLLWVKTTFYKQDRQIIDKLYAKFQTKRLFLFISIRHCIYILHIVYHSMEILIVKVHN